MAPEINTLTPSIVSTHDGIRITIHVVANAKENRVLLESDGNIMMYVHAPPVKGKANREIAKWLSKKLRKPNSHIRIVTGMRSNLKILEISGVDERGFLEAVRQNSGIGVEGTETNLKGAT